MVRFKELKARVADDFRFERREILTLLAAIFLTAFIFSFSDWGEDSFNAVAGLKNLFSTLIVVLISLSVWISFQKIYALSEGYKSNYKIWWPGLGISLLVAFISFGRFPLPLIGGTRTSFISRQRLGEFRYGFSNYDNAVICFFGIVANLLLAVLFSVGLHYFSQSYFFLKGLMFNLSMAFFSLLPLPRFNGLNIFFGSRLLYYVSISLILLFAVLLLSKTTIGLVISILVGLISTIIFLLTYPEK